MPGILSPNDQWDGSPGGGGDGVGGGGGGGESYADAVTPETGTLQILLGEGRMEGLVNGLQSVYLDGTPLQNADGSNNFKGIALALVAGTNGQPAVKGITGTESETSINVQVTHGSPATRSVSAGISAARVRIYIPALKVVDSTTGNSMGHVVTVKIERKNGAAAWEEVQLDQGGTITGGPFSSKFTKTFRVDLPGAGPYQLRVSRVSEDDADAYHLSQTWWDAVTEIVDARLRYPNSAVLSIRVNAKQFRTIPQVTLHMHLTRVQVPANYTPATYDWTTKTWTPATYRTTGPGTTMGGWDGTFTEAWSSNPAWVWFDAATKTRYGAGTFLQAAGIDKWTLYAIAQWCDTMVDDGKGGAEPRMAANLYLQSPQNAIKALQQLASIFWGVVYYASGLVVPVPDSDAAPVALFTNANVEGGKFVYEGTARQARHTAAIASFVNPELGYEKDSVSYEDEDGIARYGYNPLDIQAIACNSAGQALRLAKWSVLTELLSAETVSFGSGLEGSTIRPGDVVQVADQFRAGNTRAGGRILAATPTAITLDAAVTLATGTYTLRCQTDTGLESRTVTTAPGTTATLTVSPAFTSAPAEGSTWLLQAGSQASLWRVLSVGKGDGIKFTITALLHDPAKYALLGLAAGDVIPRVAQGLTSPAPTGLVIASATRTLNDRQQLTLQASWTLDGARGYLAQASRDYGPWQDMAVSGASASLDGAQPGVWRVRVAGDWRGAGFSPWTSAAASVSPTGSVPYWLQSAMDSIAGISSDGILSKGEKPAVILEYDTLLAEQPGLDAQAVVFACTGVNTAVSAYDTAVSQLTTYLNSLT